MKSIEIIDIKDIHSKIEEIFAIDPEKGILQGNRVIRKGRRGFRTIFFPSVKNNAHMPCESRLEADNCLRMEFDESIKEYRTQPFTVRLNSKESYTPDSVHIGHFQKVYVREVKFSGSLKSDKLTKRLSKLKRIFASENIDFEIHTENETSSNPEIHNLNYIYRSSHFPIHEIQCQLALALISDTEKNYSLKEFRITCDENGLNPLVAEKLIFENRIKFDQSKKLTQDSIIWNVGDDHVSE